MMMAFEVKLTPIGLSYVWQARRSVTWTVDDQGQSDIMIDGVMSGLQARALSKVPRGLLLECAVGRPKRWSDHIIRRYFWVSASDPAYTAVCRWAQWTSARLVEA